MRKGFTLIELLIVIAIIAILALIAVPNFLEAQVRAKVSRVHADLRTYATAIEAYTVDWGRPIYGHTTWRGNPTGTSICGVPAVHTAGGFEGLRSEIGLSKLTTPVAFISNLLMDPFKDRAKAVSATGGSDRKRSYMIHTTLCDELSDSHKECRQLGYIWIMHSDGPMRVHTGSALRVVRNDGDNNIVYDSSNGTLSRGWILRTNKGVFQGRKGQ